jgi:hypothetical protein
MTSHPLRGGKATVARRSSGAIEQAIFQSDNPSQQSRQQQESIRLRTYTIPAGARIDESRVQASGTSGTVTNLQSIVLSTPMPVLDREETRATAELGAAQKDAARELGAKLASLRGITWLGAALFVFGVASLVWPPLRTVIGSVTTSAALIAGGLVLILLPTLIAGNELIILCAVGLTTGAWFLAHRHGHLRGQLCAPTLANRSGPTEVSSATKLKTKN